MTQTDTPLSSAEMRGPLESFACLSSFTPSKASCQRRSDFASSSRRENASRLNKGMHRPEASIACPIIRQERALPAFVVFRGGRVSWNGRGGSFRRSSPKYAHGGSTGRAERRSDVRSRTRSSIRRMADCCRASLIALAENLEHQFGSGLRQGHIGSRRECVCPSTPSSFPDSPSSHRTCEFAASGARTKRHAFAHGRLRVRTDRWISPNSSRRYWSGYWDTPMPCTLCFLHSHRRSRWIAYRTIA